MANEWAPRLVAPETKVPAVERIAPPEPVVVHLKAEETPKPKGWRFVPHRDQNNLIDEIIATPIF